MAWPLTLAAGNLDYLQQLVTQLDRLGIDDDEMRKLLRLAM